MRGRGSLLVLAVVFVGMVILLLTQNSQPSPSTQNTGSTSDDSETVANDPTRLFPGLATDDVQSLVVTEPNTEEPLSFERMDDDRWLVTLPDGTTDTVQANAEAYVNNIIARNFTGTVPGVEPDEYANFGLTEQDASIIFAITLRDNTVLRLIVGRNTGDNRLYARIEGRETVYLIPPATTGPEPTRAVDLATPFYTEWDVDDIFAIRLQNPQLGHTFVIGRGENDSWADADGRPIDQNVANAIARTVATMGYSRNIPIDDDITLSDFGLSLDETGLFIEIILRDGAGHVIAVGNRNPTNDSYYALVDEHEFIYLIPRDPDPIAFLTYYLNEANPDG